MIFQSLGSNYSFVSALRILTTYAHDADHEKLIHTLEKRYGGIAYLYDKGRNALAAGLVGLDISDIAINGTTCSVVVDAIHYAKMNIAYLDIAADGNFDSKTLAEKLKTNPTIKAVIVQNTYGNPCDIASIEKLASEHKLILIEDLAHSIGQKYADGREVGTVGDIVMLSFGRDKIIDVVNGGALIIREPSLLQNIKAPYLERKLTARLRDRIYPLLTYIVRRTYRIYLGRFVARAMYALKLAEHSADGVIKPIYKIPTWQAKLIDQELLHLESNLAHRQAIVDQYQKSLADQTIASAPILRYPISVPSREKLIKHLAQHGFHLSDTWYDTPIGPKRKYQQMHYPEDRCPGVLELSEHIVNLPTHRNISIKKARQLAQLVKEYHD